MAFTIRDYTCTYLGYNEYTVEPTNTYKVSFNDPPTKAELEAQGGQTANKINYVFSYCYYMTALPIIPEGATYLSCSFSSKLVEVPNLPSTLITVTFHGCNLLETVPPIPPSVERLNSAFEDCYALKGVIEINSQNIVTCVDCFRGTKEIIILKGTSPHLQDIADTADNGNVFAFTPPSPTPTWTTPVIDRTGTSRTNATDMNRLADNIYLLGGYPLKFNYADGDFVKGDEWDLIVWNTNQFATSLGQPTVSDRTSYTNLNRIETIHKQLFDRDWDIDRDDNNLYSVPVPSGAKLATVQKYGGKSLVFNQLVQNGNFADTSGWNKGGSGDTFSVSSNIATIKASARYGGIWCSALIPQGHKFYLTGWIKSSSPSTIRLQAKGVNNVNVNITPTASTDWQVLEALTTHTKDIVRFVVMDIATSGWADFYCKNAMLIDLTQMFGAGNEPTTVEEVKALLPNDYYEYNTGEIIHASVDKVVVKDADELATEYPIPQAIRNLDGYGQSNGNDVNEVDFENKVYHKKGYYNDSDVWVADVEDIDITDTLETFPVEAGGTITFHNSNGDGYRLPVPSTEEYMVSK